MIIIEIALGIVLAIFILALLPLILEGLGKLIVEVIWPLFLIIAGIVLIVIFFKYGGMLLESPGLRKATAIVAMIILIWVLVSKLKKDMSNNFNLKLSIKRIFIFMLPTFGLSIKKIDILKSIDEQQLVHQFSERAAIFEWWFKLLVEYKEEFGNCSVEKESQYNGHNLGAWVDAKVSGRLFMMSELFYTEYYGPFPTSEEINRLDELGVAWHSSHKYWEKSFEELVAYKKAHGDINVPDSKLREWISKTRTNKHALTTKEINGLDELGIVWGNKKIRL